MSKVWALLQGRLHISGKEQILAHSVSEQRVCIFKVVRSVISLFTPLLD